MRDFLLKSSLLLLLTPLLSCESESLADETIAEEINSEAILENLSEREGMVYNPGGLPLEILTKYKRKADYSISDEFNSSSLNRNKWAYRTQKDPAYWGTTDYVKMVNQKGTTFLSLRGNWKERKGSGIAAKKAVKFGFHIMRWRTVGIEPNKSTPWHPSVWTSVSNFASGADARSFNPNGKFTEIDFVEYWYQPIWHTQTIAWKDGKVDKIQRLRDNNKDFPNGTWQVNGLEYHPNYLQLWKKNGNKWVKDGKRVPINKKSNTDYRLNKYFAKAGYWILSNKYHFEDTKRLFNGNPPLEDFKFEDSWLHIDYFRFYPLYVPKK